jgi:hypothetical protein
MRVPFARQVLRRELSRASLVAGDSVLALCAGQEDHDLFDSLGFTDVTLTNLDVEHGHTREGEESQGTWIQADAHDLPFADASYDVVFVSDGLHHCRSPHLALTEMYRTARKAVVVVESRDSLTMRAAAARRLTSSYEMNDRLLETRTRGGVDFGPVPNFVFRWTEREFEKTLRTYDPEHDLGVAYYYGLDLPARLRQNAVARTAALALTTVAPQQGNTFAMLAFKGRGKPYLRTRSGETTLKDGVSRGDIQASTQPLKRRRHRIRPE